MIIDTHCHLIDEAFQQDVNQVITNAQKADVQKIVLACCDETEFASIQTLCKQYPQTLYASIGIHPENLAEDIKQQFDELFTSKQALQSEVPLIAVGEIGLDLHWDRTRLADQTQLLVWQIDWALDHDLPVLLHIRDAMQPFLELCRDKLYPLAEAKHKQLHGILHCYSGDLEQAKKALLYGDFLFGIGGTLTYKKSTVPSIAQGLGIDLIVLETDAPYLAPIPYRGKRNEPAYTAITCQYLAQLLGLTPEEVAERTSANAQRMLHI